ncbi:MAG: hypothetical protein NC344_02150 [Bacteroidales bacterium]|nr:hypothetical protein [Bacteroidales bacterium]MCM1206026.1 hypothetical protein [Bacillota bacterium]MCM1511073.1 hypothetical protein [Clostridium sp.]
MKEKLLEAFSELGFIPEEMEIGYNFTYEGINMMLMYNDEDEDFLCIAVPGIVEVEESNAVQICALMEQVNSTLKFIKAYVAGDSVWLFYEREITGNDDLQQLITRMVLRLEGALTFSRKALAELTADDGAETEAEETTDGNDE